MARRTLGRRTFLRGTLAAGGTLIAGAGRAAPTAAPDARRAPGGAAFPVEEVAVADLAAAMAGGRVTARGLAEAYLARIEAIDRKGPALAAVIETNPDALAIADGLDRERRAGKVRGPLHGIPVLVKDNLDSADRMKTTAGSLALAGAPPPAKDAFVVARLRAAGAVLLGKTNLSEWANFRGDRSTSGWSGRGGLTRNPYALDRNTSGSSSGSAAAAAASLCAAAIGTETDGSIVSPASHCALVGVKPTVGLVSRAGIVPIAHTQDTAGPMARTVRDAALLLAAVEGEDPDDAATLAPDRPGARDYLAALDPGALAGARLGVVKGLLGKHVGVDRVIRPALDVLRARGATLVEVELTSEAYDAAELEVLLFEFRADLEAYLARRGGPVKDLAALVRFNEANAGRELQWFGQELVVKASAKGGLDDPEYRRALDTCAAARRDVHGVLEREKLDALVAPTDGLAWPTDLLNGDHFTISCSTFAAVAGTPHVTVPAGFHHGLPLGLSFLGRAWSEPRLLGLAHSYEQATRARRAPTYPRTLSL